MIQPSTRRPRGLAALAWWAVAAVLVAGCASSGGSKTQAASGAATGAPGTGGAVTATPAKEPDHITVQHILIGAVGTVPGKNITRSLDEAKKLAYEIADRARKGDEPYDALVRQYTDDQWPGTYGMSNKGVAPAQGEYPREGMVPAFGNVGFKLAVGEVGVADYDPQTSPYGYHVIKRVK